MVSLHVISEQMPAEYHAVLHQSAAGHESHLVMAILAHEFWDKEHNILYVVKGSDVSEIQEEWDNENAILFIGEPADKSRFEDINYIYINENFSELDVFNCVQKIFREIYNWQQELLWALLDKRELTEICMIGYRYLQCEILIQTPGYINIAFTPGCYDKESIRFDERQQEYYCDENFIEWLNCDRGFRELANQKEMVSYYCKQLEFYSLVRNVYFDDIYTARIVILQNTGPFTEGCKELCRYLIDILWRSLKMYAIPEKYVNNYEIKQLMMSFLMGERPETRQAARILDTCGWKMEDNYLCLIMESLNGKTFENEMDYFCKSIEKQFGYGNCVVVLYNEQIVLIYNLTLGGKKDFFTKLSPFVRDNLLHVGVSETVEGMQEICYAYREATIALTMGREQEPDGNWCFTYEKYVLPYMLQMCVSELPREYLYPAGMKKLLVYDSRRGTKYVETLYIFLREKCNGVRTAECLNISRSTLLKRMDRIREITKIDFNNMEERLHYMWSLYLMELSEW